MGRLEMKLLVRVTCNLKLYRVESKSCNTCIMED